MIDSLTFRRMNTNLGLQLSSTFNVFLNQKLTDFFFWFRAFPFFIICRWSVTSSRSHDILIYKPLAVTQENWENIHIHYSLRPLTDNLSKYMLKFSLLILAMDVISLSTFTGRAGGGGPLVAISPSLCIWVKYSVDWDENKQTNLFGPFQSYFAQIILE